MSPLARAISSLQVLPVGQTDGAAAPTRAPTGATAELFMDAEEKRLAYIAALIETALHVGLDGADWANRYGLSWLSDAYNGIGPEFLPPALRKKVTDWLHVFEPAALIHDARNHVSDNTRKGFEAANDEFLFNCRKLADFWYPWYSWRRYRARFIAAALYDFVSAAPGWIAWQQAHERSVKCKV